MFSLKKSNQMFILTIVLAIVAAAPLDVACQQTAVTDRIVLEFPTLETANNFGKKIENYNKNIDAFVNDMDGKDWDDFFQTVADVLSEQNGGDRSNDLASDPLL